MFRKDVDSEGKNEIKSKFNSDNLIFTNEKTLSYSVTQIYKEKFLDFNLELLVIPGKINGGTKIKYKYYYPSDNLNEVEKLKYLDTVKLFKWEITNVMEDDNGVWIHPPRSYSLECLELSPFPQIKFPVTLGQTWSGKMYIGSGWGELKGKIVEFKYDLVELEYTSDSKNYVAKIKGISYFDSINNPYCTLNFEFDSQGGFTKLHYLFADSSSIIINQNR